MITPNPEHQHGSLAALTEEWNTLVAEKWAEVRKAKGHFIAVYRPQVAHFEDLRLRRETSDEVIQWTIEWFAARGYSVECVLDPNGESFGLREAAGKSSLENLGVRTPPIPLWAPNQPAPVKRGGLRC